MLFKFYKDTLSNCFYFIAEKTSEFLVIGSNHIWIIVAVMYELQKFKMGMLTSLSPSTSLPSCSPLLITQQIATKPLIIHVSVGFKYFFQFILFCKIYFITVLSGIGIEAFWKPSIKTIWIYLDELFWCSRRGIVPVYCKCSLIYFIFCFLYIFTREICFL